MKNDPVVKAVSDLLIPPILLFGLYVQFHGDFGPGGGFQAGVIIAVAIILHALVHGLPATRSRIPDHILRITMAAGVILYVGVGFSGILAGGEFLNYSVLADDPLTGQHIGVLLIELGVGCTVASVLIMLFYQFAGRKGQR
jgi:multicomponent Na+:H+ antiporter subunit B